MSTLKNKVSSQYKSTLVCAKEPYYVSVQSEVTPEKTVGSLASNRIVTSLAAAFLFSLCTFLLSPTLATAAPVYQETTPLPMTITIKNEVEPATAADRFDLLLDGEVVEADVSDGGSSDAILIPFPDTYTVSVQSATDIPLEAYETSLFCVNTSGETLVDEITTSASIEIKLATGVTCTFTHTRRPVFVAKLNDILLIDADVETEPGTSPGDTIQLQTVITKELGIAATNVVFSVPIDTNTVIVSGTLSTSTGIVDQGSSSEDSAVRVLIGDVADDTPIVITWNVTVNSPLPANVDTVSFQGQVSSDNGLPVLTDDPSIPALADPTEISVTAKPLLNVTHFALLLIDADNDQQISAGDRVYYEVVVINIGNGPAYNLLVEGTVDPNTSLIPESLMSTRGSVTADGGDIQLTLDALEGGGGRLTLNYQVLIDSEITATSISSQFEASADIQMEPGQRIRVLSDDPRTLVPGDATVAPVVPHSLAGIGIFLPYISLPQTAR